MPLSAEANNVNWLMVNFVDRTPGVDQAIAVSSDGLLIALSSSLDRTSADKLAAIITGMRALAQGAANELARGPVVQVLLEMSNAYLFIASIAGGTALGVVAAKSCDLGLVGYEVAMLADRVGAQLTPGLITELKNALVAV
jgi:predicted regulator of Ras-like GTPase activity (Roadblock/LC7/MglB family)